MEDQIDQILKEKILSAVESPLPELTRRDVELPRISNSYYLELGIQKRDGILKKNKIILKKDYKYMPANNARFCTRIFKIEPIEKYLKDKGEIEMCIGLNYDEQGRTGNLEKLKNFCKFFMFTIIINSIN